tara:strand:- start:193 stop:978 length:786 start_codon:yes stop_codon:yes gene_type:complete
MSKYLNKNFSDVIVKQNNNLYGKEYENMKKSDKSITDFPVKKLNQIKDKTNLSLTKLQALTNVNRGVLERFLDGKKINHIDYRRILKKFPEIEQGNIAVGLDVIPYQIFGCLIDNGIVRHLYLNEDQVFYCLAHFKKVFPRETIAIRNYKSNNIFLCQYRPSMNIFNEDNLGYEFLIKTEIACYFGVMQRNEDEYHLVDIMSHKVIKLDDGTPIREVYDLVVKVSKKWSDIKNNNLNSIVRDPDYMKKQLELDKEKNDIND